MDPQVEVDRILKEYRATMVRHKKHQVWRFPDGRIYVQASTPSDFRSAGNNLRDLRKMLGLGKERGKPGERREKAVKCRPATPPTRRITPSASTAMLDALRKNGLVEDALNARIGVLTVELRNSRKANTRRRMALRQMHAHCAECWGCRLARWVRKIRARLVF